MSQVSWRAKAGEHLGPTGGWGAKTTQCALMWAETQLSTVLEQSPPSPASQDRCSGKRDTIHT